MKSIRGKSPQHLRSILIFTAVALFFIVNGVMNIDRLWADTDKTLIVPGDMGGDFSVGLSGNALYTIPVPVPPGINKADPKLILEYNSGLKNSKLGVGWRLKGSSAITRCSPIPAIDGKRGTVTYTSQDRYCIDGQRLINIKGDYGSPGSVYRTELETWRLVTASDSGCGSGPCWFKVIQRDGAVAYYGQSDDSRILAKNGQEVRVWALNKITDNNNNSIEFTYTTNPLGGTGDPSTTDCDQYYLARIDYTSNQQAQVQANRSVRFSYEKRPDITTRYIGGEPIITNARLCRIQTFVKETLVKNYTITYKQSPASKRSLLESIQVCSGSEGEIQCLPATEITWQGQKEVSFNSADAGKGLSLPSSFQKIIPMDVNGDGLGDLVYIYVSQQNYNVVPLISNGSVFTQCNQTIQIPIVEGARIMPGDVNADGSTDLIYARPDSQTLAFDIYPGTPGQCKFSGPHTVSTDDPATFKDIDTADINGDGRTDIVASFPDQGQLIFQTYLSNGTGFAPGGNTTVTPQENGRFLFMDINGDAMIDLVQSANSSGMLNLTSYISDGKTFGEPVQTKGISSLINLEKLLPMDVNSDSMVDVVQLSTNTSGILQIQPLFSNGTGGFAAGDTTDTGNGLTGLLAFWPMDVVGDGQIDLVQAYTDGKNVGLVVYRNINTGFDKGTVVGSGLSPADSKNIWPLDFTGDGKTDLVQAWTTPTNLNLTVFISEGEIPDLVNAFTNSLGGEVVVSYLPMSNSGVYDRGTLPESSDHTGPAMTYPYRSMPALSPYQLIGGGIRPLVAKVTESNNAGRNSSTYSYSYQYFYRGGLVGLDGRGWLGFKTVEKLNMQSGRRQITTLNQLFPLTGTTAAIEYQGVKSVSPDPLCVNENTPLTSSVIAYTPFIRAKGATQPYPPVYEVLKSSVVFNTYSYGAYDFSRGRTYKYDDYGNLTLLSELGYVKQDGTDISPDDNVYTCSAFYNEVSGTGWKLGYLEHKKISKVDKCDFSNFDDKNDFHLEHFTYYNPGMELESYSIYDNVNKVTLKTTYGYDTFGNKTSQTLPGNNRTSSATYEKEFNTYPFSQTTAPNDNNQTCTQYFGYDPKFGIRVAEKSVNNTIYIRCLDSLGRIAKLQETLPTEPEGVKGEDSCLTADVTGDKDFFNTGKFITTEVRSHQTNSSKQIYYEISRLQDWPVNGAAPVFRYHRRFYDGKGRLYMGTAQSDNNGGDVVVRSQLNSGDKVTATSVPYFAGSGNDYSPVQGSKILWDTWKYDVYGRTASQTTVVDDSGETSVTEFAYSKGLVTRVTKAAGQVYKYTKILTHDYYNGKRKIKSTVVPGDNNATTLFAYDNTGRLLSVRSPVSETNPQGVLNTITYDSVGRRTSIDNPDQNTLGDGHKAVKMTYSPVTGLLETKTDTKNQIVTFIYDPRSRITTKKYSDGTSIVYSYDSDTVSNGKGHLTGKTAYDKQSKQVYAYVYGYDPYGNRNHRELTLAGVGTTYKGQRVFDPLNRLSTRTFPDQTTVCKKYEMGNLTQVEYEGQPYAVFSDFNALGLACTIQYANKVSGKRSYSPIGQPTVETLNDGKGNAVIDQTLVWDNLFNLQSIVDNLAGSDTNFTQQYGYKNNRLIKAGAPGLYDEQNYEYSPLGNLVKIDGNALKYEAHRVISGTTRNGQSFEAHYDANGNMEWKKVGDTHWDYTYDIRNRMISVQKEGSTLLSVPVYNDSGRRLIKRTPDGVEVLYIEPGYQVTNFPGGDSQITKSITGPTGLIATVTTGKGGKGAGEGGVPKPGTLYFHQNQVNSTTLTFDEQGNPQSRVVYLPYGGIIRSKTTGPDDFRLKYQAKELDNTTNLYYFNARYYDPVTCRFISPDTRTGAHYFKTDNLNRFCFALNNPATYIDPTGHNIWQSIAGVAIGVAEVAAGVAIDVLSDGALEPLGGTLIGAGFNGITYSATHSKNFSWKQFGVQEAEGAVIGLVTAGIGEAVGAAFSVAADAAEDAAVTASEDAVGDAIADSSGDELNTEAAETSVSDAEETGDSGADDMSDDSETTCQKASFIAGTPVWSHNQTVPIEVLETGDMVLSRNSLDRKDHGKTIGKLYQREVDEVVQLSFKSPDGTTDTMALTFDHPIYIIDKGWIRASEVEVGEIAASRLNGTASITGKAIVKTEKAQKVFNFNVTPYHSYFVGKLGIWVHNPCYAIDRSGMGKRSPQGYEYDVELQVPRSEYPESADHITDAQKVGHDDVLTIDRAGAKANRRASLRGWKTQRGYDRDEYPPAMFEEGGENADIQLIGSADNRASGSSFGGQLRQYGNGTRVWFHVVK